MNTKSSSSTLSLSSSSSLGGRQVVQQRVPHSQGRVLVTLLEDTSTQTVESGLARCPSNTKVPVPVEHW